MSAITSISFVVRGAFWTVGAVAVFVTIYPLAARVQRRSQDRRPGGITTIDEPAEPDFEIVAVHGLGAHPDHTWEGKPADGQRPRTHLLKHLLRSDFPTARILSFAYNSDWLVDAPETTAQQIGKDLRKELDSHRRDSQRLPIIFIGHSFGGIVIKEALRTSDQPSVLEDTCGIIFLGTPHQGSSLSTAAALLSQLTGFLGSNDTLLLNLRHNHSQLSDLEDGFRPVVKDKPVLSFYETRPTYFLGLSVGCIVDRESARGSSIKLIDIDTNHVGLNKFDSADNPGYRKLKAAIEGLRVKPLLEQADDHIREKHYTNEILKIERLSGDPLSLDQCYINLAIVEQTQAGANSRNRSGGGDSRLSTSPFSLLARQKVEISETQSQIPLMDIFNQRKGPDNTTSSPRRILIRGRAGVGKTTLCKKMVYDFLRKGTWSERFDRVLWVPLRNLKQRVGSGYDLKKLFDHEFFRFSGEDGEDGGTRFSKELFQALTHDRTLFILDGWDEVAGTDENDDMFPLLRELLNQPRAVITSRPSAVLPHGIKVDLELETIGFSPAQVHEYIDKAHGKNVDELKTFLRSHELVRGLVRIPIQLDAFCYCWDDLEGSRTEDSYTMTTLYQAIQTSLWRKDIVRLEKMAEQQRIAKSDLVGASQESLEEYVEDELRFLEHLAFAGLAADMIEFGQKDRNSVHKYADSRFLSAKNLPRLSFLRTADLSAKPEHQLYHFIHLTFQEYFAARFFVRHWIEEQQMEYIILGQKDSGVVSPSDFLQEHKYDAGYDIMWRFVAGLLDDADQRQSSAFFEAIEKEPVDLLGPTHQRLVMHCLSEAKRLPRGIREGRERRLAEWVMFESDYTGFSRLAREPELPDGVLCDVLRRCDSKGAILAALVGSERVLPNLIIAILVALLKDEDSDVRLSAAQALGNQSSLSDAAVAALVEVLKDEDSYVRDSAVQALGSQSSLSDAAVAAFVELLKDEDSDVRRSAVQALNSQSSLSDAAVAAFVELLKDEDSDVRRSAVQALNSQSSLSDAAVAALVEVLKDEDSDVRRSATLALGNQSSLSDAAVAALVELLNDEDSDVRRFAVLALGSQSSLSDAAVAALVEVLKDEDSDVRYSAALALNSQSSLSDAAVAALVELLKDEDSDVRRFAVLALNSQSSLSDAAVAALVEVLKDEDSNVRYSAALALNSQSPLSDAAVAALVEVFKHKDSDVRRSATLALGNQSSLSDAAVAALVELLKDEKNYIRYSAAKALGNQSSLSDAAVAAFVELLKDEKSYVRSSAVRALGNQSSLSDAAVAAFVELLKDEKSYVRRSAVQALNSQSSLSHTAVAAFVELLKDEKSYVRDSAVQALGSQSSLSDAAVAAFVELLKDEDSDVRRSAVQALNSQSSLSHAAVAALVELLKHEDRQVRNSAAQAISDTPLFISKVMEVLGFSAQSQSRSLNETQTLRHIQYIGPLYQILLRQGFNEQFSLYNDNKNDNLITINQSSGLRTAYLGNNENTFQASVVNGRRSLQEDYSYTIWRSLEGMHVDPPLRGPGSFCGFA